jgi:glyoxylase-like metal-dependent hydrolase (beta-lactamase superfamily II)
VTDGVYQSMFVVTSSGVVVVDAPPSIGANLTKAIAEVTALPVTHMIYSHSHTDHIGSSTVFPDAIPIIAHEETKRLLVRSADPNRRIPTVTFSDTYMPLATTWPSAIGTETPDGPERDRGGPGPGWRRGSGASTRRRSGGRFSRTCAGSA